MVNYAPFFESIRRTQLAPWLEAGLPQQVEAALDAHGNYAEWLNAVASLPALTASSVDLIDAVRVGSAEDCDEATQAELRKQLMRLHPWRKGPFELFGLHVDTEWRSDWKWDRLKNAIQPLAQRRVLDVGCGNGYHCWRMIGAGAKEVIGLDPFVVFVMQYWAVRKLIAKALRREDAKKNLPTLTDHRAFEMTRSQTERALLTNFPLSTHHSSLFPTVLPLGIEALPPKLRAFDTVFSMGVLYHRRSPFDHLFELREALRAGGELVLETLVVDGPLGEVLVPEGRYAQMRNVWFLPSVLTLESWLKKAKFRNVQLVDVTPTTIDEQRPTEWMTFNSLPDFLDPNDAAKTREGHPAPVRAIFTAEAP